MRTTPLYVEKSGDPSGPTLVFLHGIGTSSWMWKPQLNALSDFNCIAPDLPGHGKSNHIPWRSFSETARLISHIINANARGQRAYIIGLSLGAYVGLQLLSEFDFMVNRAILSGLHALPMPNQALMIAMNYLIAPVVKTGLVVRFNARALRLPPWEFDGYCHSVRQLSTQAFLRASNDAVRFEIPDNLASIGVPTLVAAGEREPALIHRSLTLLADAMADAQPYIVPNAGHGWSLEMPRLFAKTVRDWVQARPLPPRLQPVL
ncbi:MAG: alpha/beta fold hydrolase [Cyanobacteria bacterium P01_A01_bin.135]